MFSRQSLRAVVRPGEILVREQRLGAAVRLLAVCGTLDASTAGELARRIDATPGGVRWLIVDLAAAVTVADEALAALVEAGRELRRCAGELIVAGGPGDTARRLAAFDVAQRPAQVASVDEAVMMLARLPWEPGARDARAGQRVVGLTLPRIDPAS